MRPKLNLEDRVYVFMSTSDRVAQLYSQAPGSLFVALCDLKGFGGGILTRLHMGVMYTLPFLTKNKVPEIFMGTVSSI
jgi:hypothetical protein